MIGYLRWWYLLSAQRAARRFLERRRLQRNKRLAADAFGMSDREFVKTYRLTKPLVRELIGELRPHIPKERRRDGLNVAVKTLIALAFYASGAYQTLVGQSVSHTVSQPTVSRAVKQVTQALNKPSVFKKFIRFPITREDREKVRTRFFSKFGIPGVVGFIDGTHVSIVKPQQHEESYYCRKGYHSLNVMVICDADLNILCVDPSSPGSCHDSTVWRDHPLNNYLLELNESGETNFLLGDSGYPLRINLMTPITNAVEGSPEAHYYNMHVRARNVVERTIGVLKARYRCLLGARQLQYGPETAAKIVNACCVLINLANKKRLSVVECTQHEREEEQRLQLQQRYVELALPTLTDDVAAPPRSRNPPLAQGRLLQQALVESLWNSR